ncbi:Hypothetical predicted protein [Octopus vulgaris]|uniref:Uncharacterized protein n=1 Tax=Octopus vulgaris TaxID=6645 RepID=A0AA36F623_OCTVU|nr:Hypothetical predicted protein [Octopus vulgaris]
MDNMGEGSGVGGDCGSRGSCDGSIGGGGGGGDGGGGGALRNNFLNFTDLVTFSCSAKVLTSVGNVSKLMATFAASLKGFPPVASLYSKTSNQNASVLDVFVHLTK